MNTIERAKEHLEDTGFYDGKESYCVADNIISELLELVSEDKEEGGR